jgi:hypothetical protein
MLFSVRFYDGREDVIPREEVYYITHDKFTADVEFIVRCEESLVGKAVVARNDSDGLFYLGKTFLTSSDFSCLPDFRGFQFLTFQQIENVLNLGHVRDRVGNGRQYVVQWPEGPCQVQVHHDCPNYLFYIIPK